MILTAPKLTGDNCQTRPGERKLGQATFVLWEKARRHDWAGVGCSSIKTFFNGHALYSVGRGFHAVDSSRYLVLNDGQSYAISIDSKTPVESFCIFFEHGFVEETVRCVHERAERLLDEPEAGRQSRVEFVERTYPHDAVLSPALFCLREKLGAGRHESLWLEEHLHQVTERLLAVHQNELRQMARLTAMRAATREELYRRAYRARDYAEALFHERVSLRHLAQAACLSPNHLLRVFRQVFGMTPHQYLSARRLQEATRLLSQTETSVTEICLDVGFQSLGSFSALFRRSFGLSPQAYRRQKGDFGEATEAFPGAG